MEGHSQQSPWKPCCCCGTPAQQGHQQQQQWGFSSGPLTTSTIPSMDLPQWSFNQPMQQWSCNNPFSSGHSGLTSSSNSPFSSGPGASTSASNIFNSGSSISTIRSTSNLYNDTKPEIQIHQQTLQQESLQQQGQGHHSVQQPQQSVVQQQHQVIQQHQQQRQPFHPQQQQAVQHQQQTQQWPGGVEVILRELPEDCKKHVSFHDFPESARLRVLTVSESLQLKRLWLARWKSTQEERSTGVSSSSSYIQVVRYAGKEVIKPLDEAHGQSQSQTTSPILPDEVPRLPRRKKPKLEQCEAGPGPVASTSTAKC